MNPLVHPSLTGPARFCCDVTSAMYHGYLLIGPVKLYCYDGLTSSRFRWDHRMCFLDYDWFGGHPVLLG